MILAAFTVVSMLLLLFNLMPAALKYINKKTITPAATKANIPEAKVAGSNMGIMEKLNKTVAQLTAKAEEELGGRFPQRKRLVSSAFWLEKNLAHKRIINNYAQDSMGWTQELISQESDTSNIAASINALSAYCNERGINFLYMFPPNRIMNGINQLPEGVVDQSNEILSGLKSQIDARVLDLGSELDSYPFPPEELFYASDHHWTIPTALWAAIETTEYMQEHMGLDLAENSGYLDYQNYERLKYEKIFLGSYGQNTLAEFTGIDDFVYMEPEKVGNYTLTQVADGQILEMRTDEFGESLVYKEMITQINPEYGYATEPYACYSGYGNTVKYIQNHNNQSGQKLLVVGASNTRSYSCFLAPFFSQVCNIDPRKGESQQNIYQLIDEFDPDYVIVSLGRLRIMRGVDAGF